MLCTLVFNIIEIIIEINYYLFIYLLYINKLIRI